MAEEINKTKIESDSNLKKYILLEKSLKDTKGPSKELS